MGAPPRARAGTTRVTALATANSGIRGNAGLDRTSAARRRAGCGALSTRCAVVSTGGTHLTHTTHPIMNGSLLCMHTLDTRTIPRQRISCLIIVVRHAFTHASLPSPPRAKHPRPGSSSGGRRHDGSSALVKGTSAQPGTDCSVRYFLPLLLPKIRLMGDAWRGLGDAGFALRPGESGRGDAERGDAGRALPLPRPGLSWRAARPGES